ncbi:MFS transporter [Nocardiopsis akebiae]|uniref:MFS transporter n=1 Tax=Nocardiopsis akebiae TaxID=2831968 RepID=A0ABX8BZA0_9ACTN|nr:MFS transporter [Nocardiopsis akebiae]QUX27040.1 MFS transporter [Nocardiopsis akebiae]
MEPDTPHTGTHTNGTARAPVRDRAVLGFYFFAIGMLMAVWASRIPAVTVQTGSSSGEMGVALLALALGAVTAMLLSGRLLDRFGPTRFVPLSAAASGLALVLPGHVSGHRELAAVLFLFGASHALLNISANAQATHLQRARGRPIMASFHALASLGACFGAVMGMLAAQARLDALTTFQVACVLIVAPACGLYPVLTSLMPAYPRVPGSGKGPKRGPRLPSRRIVLLGALAMSCMLAEGAAQDWSALFTREILGGSETAAAGTFAAFTVAMTVGRLVGDRMTRLLGPVTLVRSGSLLAACGLGLAVAVPHTVTAPAGFALMGIGLSCVMPQVFTAAADYEPAKAGRHLCTVSAFGYCGPLIGPPGIGALAERAGLSWGLLLPIALILVVAAKAGALRPPTAEDGDGPPGGTTPPRRSRPHGRTGAAGPDRPAG